MSYFSDPSAINDVCLCTEVRSHCLSQSGDVRVSSKLWLLEHSLSETTMTGSQEMVIGKV